ncbi:MAG: KpsF/GutQ family sugar-phosphate isomerase [Alphaproteobacteria bacterium]|jgi:arabinose-5-phosphate isomerase|tara:strand:+ start:974 stop:1924 length:951 start_codon:yes stop_codon:yes gene_type:complete
MNSKKEIIFKGKEAIKIQLEGVKKLQRSLNEDFYKAVELLLSLKGKLILSGIGKSGHIANKIASTFTSTGIVSLFLHPVEASHGDLGIIEKKDIVILISNSGEANEINDIINYCKKNGVKIICITSNKNSSLSKNSDVKIIIPKHKESDPLGIAPTTSTTLALIAGDALCSTILAYKKFDRQSFKNFHPGGKIGKNLRTINEIMNIDAPLVSINSKVLEAVIVMTEKKYGCAIIVDIKKNIKGIVTDGDLRRSLKSDLLEANVTKIMRINPILVNKNTLVSSAINIMNKNSITSLIIAEKKKVLGIVNLKECLDNE